MGFFKSLMGGGNKKQELATKIEQGARVIDVRTAEEFSDGHYPNAVNIPVDAMRSRLGDFGPKDKPVIVYCASGARSAMAAQVLRSQGYSDVTNAGGLGDLP